MWEFWKIISEKELLKVGTRLRVSLQHLRLPDGREVDDYLHLSMPPFVTIVAQTTEGSIICERQYKHGPRRVVLTLPAGNIEENEEPLDAAKRELLEETGYASNGWQFLCTRITHANAGGSYSHAFLATGCRKIAEPNSGDLEEMAIELVTPAELLCALAAGDMPLMADTSALLSGLQALEILKGTSAVGR